MRLKKIKTTEEKLEEIKKQFVELIPQIQDIQRIQEVSREVQKKEIREEYPFINIHTSSNF